MDISNNSCQMNLSILMEPNNSYTFERAAIGIMYMIVTLSMLIPYSIILYIIQQTKQIYDPTFRLLALNMGYSDLIQLVFLGLISSLACLIPFEFPYGLNKFFGSMTSCGWFAYVSLSQCMAFNRLITIYWPLHAQSIFTRRVTMTIICLSWAHGLAWIIVNWTPLTGMKFNVATYSMDIDLSLLGSHAFLILNAVIDWVHVCIMCTVYALIYIKVVLKKNQILDASLIANEKQERKVQLQAVLLCSMDVGAVVFYILFQFVPENRWTSLLGNLAWLISAGGNAFIYLAINSIIQRKFMEIFRHGAAEQTTSTKISMIKNSRKVQSTGVPQY